MITETESTQETVYHFLIYRKTRRCFLLFLFVWFLCIVLLVGVFLVPLSCATKLLCYVIVSTTIVVAEFQLRFFFWSRQLCCPINSLSKFLSNRSLVNPVSAPTCKNRITSLLLTNGLNLIRHAYIAETFSTSGWAWQYPLWNLSVR